MLCKYSISNFVKQKVTFSSLGYLFFVFWIMMAIYDAYARILISDPAFYLFNIINRSGFFVPGVRYTTVVNQLFAVLAVNLNLPLKVVIPIFSVSFVVVRLFYFYLVTTVLKNKAAGFSIIFVTVLGVSESYFRPTSESTIALLNSILLYAWLCYSEDYLGSLKIKRLIGFIGSLFLIAFGYFTHPIALFSLLFSIGFFIVRYGKLKHVYSYLTILFTLFLFFNKVIVQNNLEHHAGIYGNLLTSPLIILDQLQSYYPYKFFINYFKVLYFPLALFLIYVLIYQFWKKEWLQSVFLILFSMVYFTVVCVSFKEGDSNMQMEKIFLPLFMFMGIALGSVLFRSDTNKNILFPVFFFAAVIYGLIKIDDARPAYYGRIEYLKEIVAEAKSTRVQKLIISNDEIDRNKMIFTWASGIETLMLSTMQEKTSPVTVFISNDLNEDNEALNENNFIATPFFQRYNQQSFNKNYFELPLQKYRRLHLGK